MKTHRNNPARNASAATLIALVILGVNSPVLAAAAAEKSGAEKYERDALKFEADADLASRMAERYRAESNGGSKQRMTLV